MAFSYALENGFVNQLTLAKYEDKEWSTMLGFREKHCYSR